MIGFFNAYHTHIMKAMTSGGGSAASLKCLLLRDTGNYTFNPDHTTVDDILDSGVPANDGIEISVASYARQTLAGVSPSQDDTNDRGILDATNVQFGTLESGQTVEAIVFFIQVNDDSDSIPYLYFDGKVGLTAMAPASQALTGSITGATNANPAVITSAAHGLSNGDKVRISGVGGMTEINGLTFTVVNVTTNTFELSGINSIGYGAYTSGGSWSQVVRVYTGPLLYGIPAATSVSFAGSAGTVDATAAAGSYYIDVIGLSGDVTEGDEATEVQTAINLPAPLGNSNFDVNFGSDGAIAQRDYSF